MRKRLYMVAIIMIFLTHSVLAHDGEEHTDLDFLIAVIGLIAIFGALYYSFIWNQPKTSKFDDIDHDSE